ncbi:MAG: histone H1 [Balneolaceae bacterium]|nr:histone H1 [Balneolaceae bacterium]
MSRYDEMNELLDQLEPDIKKFYNKGNKAAGTRARKTLQEIKKTAQDIRLEIQEWKNTGKVDEI